MNVNDSNRTQGKYNYGQNELPSDKKTNPLRAALNKIQRGAEAITGKIRSATDKPIGKNLSSSFKKALKKEAPPTQASRQNETLHQRFQTLAKPISDALSKAQLSDSKEVKRAAISLQKEVGSIVSDIRTNASVNIDKRMAGAKKALDELNRLLEK
ncbi:MAG: hypothetical protein ACK4HV_03135 [Parachlamydiaceae bacterium]